MPPLTWGGHPSLPLPWSFPALSTVCRLHGPNLLKVSGSMQNPVFSEKTQPVAVSQCSAPSAQTALASIYIPKWEDAGNDVGPVSLAEMLPCSQASTRESLRVWFSVQQC